MTSRGTAPMIQETSGSPEGLSDYSPYMDISFVSFGPPISNQPTGVWSCDASTFAEERRRTGCCLTLGVDGSLSMCGVCVTSQGQLLQRDFSVSMDRFRYGREYPEVKKEKE